MKLSKITLACLLATSGISISSTANAEITQEYEFGGYVRTGLYYSVENDYKSINGGGQKETLGRLGLEFDDDASLNVGSVWSFDNGNEIRVSAGIDDDASLGYSLEMKGITPSGTLWGGGTGYGKDNYIFMTDFFYTDMSGTGIGIKGYEMGDLFIDVAYIASNRDDDDYDLDDASFANNENLDNYMHTFNVAVTYNSWEVSLSGKAMVDNWDEDGTEYAETGADITVIYTLDDFFWTGSGQGTIIAQAGRGLGSGNLLGGTINDYNAYAPGSLFQGEHEDWVAWHPAKGKATRLISYVDEKDTSARLLVWGGYNFDNGISIFPSLQAQYNDHMIDAANETNRSKVRDILGAFLFRGDEVDKYVKVLSGGERNRLALAKLLLQPLNVLIMDEPTNHLDIKSKNVLKEALDRFQGTLVLVSHDRDFLKGLTNKVYEFKDQKINEYLGDIDFFLEQRNLENLREAEKRNVVKVQKDKTQVKQSYEDQKKLKSLNNRLSKIESRINQLEKEIKEIDVELQSNYDATVADPNFFEGYQKKKQNLQEFMNNWEEIQLEIESF